MKYLTSLTPLTFASILFCTTTNFAVPPAAAPSSEEREPCAARAVALGSRDIIWEIAQHLTLSQGSDANDECAVSDDSKHKAVNPYLTAFRKDQLIGLTRVHDFYTNPPSTAAAQFSKHDEEAVTEHLSVHLRNAPGVTAEMIEEAHKGWQGSNPSESFAKYFLDTVLIPRYTQACEEAEKLYPNVEKAFKSAIVAESPDDTQESESEYSKHDLAEILLHLSETTRPYLIELINDEPDFDPVQPPRRSPILKAGILKLLKSTPYTELDSLFDTASQLFLNRTNRTNDSEIPPLWYIKAVASVPVDSRAIIPVLSQQFILPEDDSRFVSFFLISLGDSLKELPADQRKGALNALLKFDRSNRLEIGRIWGGILAIPSSYYDEVISFAKSIIKDDWDGVKIEALLKGLASFPPNEWEEAIRSAQRWVRDTDEIGAIGEYVAGLAAIPYAERNNISPIIKRFRKAADYSESVTSFLKGLGKIQPSEWRTLCDLAQPLISEEFGIWEVKHILQGISSIPTTERAETLHTAKPLIDEGEGEGEGGSGSESEGEGGRETKSILNTLSKIPLPHRAQAVEHALSESRENGTPITESLKRFAEKFEG